jgi:hypothetical protein
MEISTKVRVVTAEHRCSACGRISGSAALLRFHQASQHKLLGPPQRAMRLSSATNDPATPSSQAGSESQQPSDDCQQTLSNGSINGFYSPSISTPDDHCNHTNSQLSIPNSSIGNRNLSLESHEFVGAGKLDHVNSSYIDSTQQNTVSATQNSSRKVIEINTRPITPVVSPDLAEKLLSDAVQFIKMLEGVHDSLLAASSCLEKAKILSPPESQNIPTSETDSSSNANEPMLIDPPSILKQCPNESDEAHEITISRQISSTAQNLDALAGLELLSSVSLAVGSESSSSAQPVNPPTESLASDSIATDVTSAMQPHSTARSSDANTPIPVSSADRLERACDLLGLSRKLPPDASDSLSCVSPFVGPRTLAQHDLADAHEKTLRATVDLQLVEQHTRGSTFCFYFWFRLISNR